MREIQLLMNKFMRIALFGMSPEDIFAGGDRRMKIIEDETAKYGKYSY